MAEPFVMRQNPLALSIEAIQLLRFYASERGIGYFVACHDAIQEELESHGLIDRTSRPVTVTAVGREALRALESKETTDG